MPRHAETPYVNIARVEKTEGLKGKVVVRSLTGLPFSLSSGACIHFTPPTLRGIDAGELVSIEGNGPCYSVKVKGIDGIDDARKLVDRTVLVARADLLLEGTPALLIGREVHSAEEGDLGRITEVMSTPANDVWVVQGAFGEVLLPVIDDVVISVPSAATEPIEVELLPGLLPDHPSGAERDGGAGTSGETADDSRSSKGDGRL